MANVAYPRNIPADLGGNHLQNHKLLYDAPSVAPRSDARPPSDESTQGTKHQTEGRGSAQSTEKVANENEEDDGHGGQADDQEDDDDEPEVKAPSHGYGKGKGKRPAIRIENAGDDESENDDDETTSREAGRLPSMHLVNQLRNSNKKRTFSNVSNTSLLFGEDDAAMGTFPRPKIPRTLSHSGGTGLLAYTLPDNENRGQFENAVESSGDEQEIASQPYHERATDDDDEDYSGLNQISDDESDLEKVEELEESFIINSEIQHASSLFSTDFTDARRLSLDSFGSGDIFDFAPDSYYATADVGFNQFFEPDPRPASPALAPAPEPMAKRKFSDSSAKRVRFDDEVQMSDDESSSESSELDSSLFPDLFMDQDKLPRSLYHLVEADSESDHEDFPSSASDQSYWDYGQTEVNGVQPKSYQEFDDDSSEAGSSGYESDMGDTTDEYDSDLETASAPQTPRQKSVLNRPSSAPASRAASPSTFPRSAIGPTRGIFIHEDSRQAIAVTNRTTKNLTFYRPRAPVRQSHYATYSSGGSTANNSPRASLIQHLNATDNDLANDVFNNTFLNSTDIMLTGIFGGAPDAYLYGGNSVGPPEAFYPFVSIGQNGMTMTDEDEYGDDDDFEHDVNLTDFMDFGDDVDATDVEAEEDTDVPATPGTSTVGFNGSTPAKPTPKAETRERNKSDAMLEHFDRAGVTAFRNNQNRFRDMACLPHDPNLRASVSRPIRSGRSAETLMSPLRKRSSMSKKHGNSNFSGLSKSVLNGRRGPRMGSFS